jgi:hypothetical protein
MDRNSIIALVFLYRRRKRRRNRLHWVHREKKEEFGAFYTKGKGKATPLQAWTGPEGSGRLRLPNFKTTGT